ncbi:MAG: rhodanese-like domain-containing protein [Acidobacteria bacterium]|nr:rhodanese-like domain-containing protein [Acidobacteriota bacterium]
MKKISLSLRLVSVAIAACLAFACSNSNGSSEAPASANTSSSPGGAMTKLGQSSEADVARINVAEARKLVSEGKAIIVDVRGSESYKMSHIKGSLDFALHKLEAGDYKGLPKDKIIITYCACPAENSSARAAAVLKKAGFKDPGALVGGIQAWESSGGEIEKASQELPRKG